MRGSRLIGKVRSVRFLTPEIAIMHQTSTDSSSNATASALSAITANPDRRRSLNLDTVLQALVDVTVDVLGVDKSMVSTWDADARVMTLRAWRNLGEPTLDYIRTLFNQRTQSLDVPRVIITEDPARAEPHLVPI